MIRRLPLLSSLLLALLASCSALAGGARNPATTPAPRDHDWWYQRHGLLCQRAAAGPELVFLGDSITQQWETAGAEVWQQYYGARDVANLGIGGDETEHVLWRLDHGNWPGIHPKAVVLLIGTNNVGNTGGAHTAPMIAAGIEDVVERIRTASPETHVLLLAVFPRDPGPSPMREVIADINARVQRLADGEWVRYRDLGPLFLETDGVLLPTIMPDFLHLSGEGYRRWAEAIEPDLVEWLGRG